MPPRAQTNTESILLVDDEAESCDTLERFLRRRGYRVASSANVNEALKRATQERFDLIITDACLPGETGFELLDRIKSRGSEEDVVIMTGATTSEQGVEAMRCGASDYLTKPCQLQEVADVVARVMTRRRQRFGGQTGVNGNGFGQPRTPGNGHSNGNGRSYAANAAGLTQGGPLIGSSPVMKQLFSVIDRIAPSDSSVFITGATGTGKELVARAIHGGSLRRKAPFVDINCSAIPDTLVEAELFGHQRGTFTGAHETRRGLFEEASGGTLFLDEVDALDLSAQAKLLRVLQERMLRRVGGRENIPVNVRIISATNHDLSAAIAGGKFRPDLLFRLRVVPLHMPDLRARGNDIALLVDCFLQRHTQPGTKLRRFSEEAMRALLAYHWPGNVRELENAVEYALAIGVGEELGIEDIPPDVLKGNQINQDLLQECTGSNLPLAEVERRYILSTLERFGGHQIKTAAALGIDRRTLYRKLQQYKVVTNVGTNLVNSYVTQGRKRVRQ